MIKKLKIWGLVILVSGFISGCISIPVPQPDLTNPIHTVVILPFANESNSVDAPNQIRDLLEKKLTAKFYKVTPRAEVDQLMVDRLGITLGEQLSEVEFSEIKKNIAADAYIYGNITHYDQTMSGVLNTNRVRTEMKMVQARDDSVFWNSNIGIKSESRSDDLFGNLASMASAISDSQDDEITWITIERKTGGDGSVLGNLISGLVEKAISNMTDTVLTEESVSMINYATQTLRNGPGI
jgi:hypothetical protein